MQVQIHTDRNIEGDAALTGSVEAVVRDSLSRFGDQVTRVEVHLSDLNGQKAGPDDKRCLLEARVAGRQPVAVSHEAATLHQAVTGAARKLKNNLAKTFGRLKR
jgi:ribosome-associated translation inhibitor RaiA